MLDECVVDLRELRSASIQCMEGFAPRMGVKSAQCWLGIYVSDEQKLISFASWRNDLPEVCNVSGIEFLAWAREFPPSATASNGFAVLPFMPKGTACPRCRKSHEDTETRDGLCARCDTVIAGMIEKGEWYA